MYLTYSSVAEAVSAVMANQARVAVVEGEVEEERLDTALASVASAVVVTVTRQEVRVREAASGAGAGCRLGAGRAGLQQVNTELLPWLYTARPGLVLVRLLDTLDTLDTDMREVVEYCVHQLQALARGRMVLIGTGVEALVGSK